MEVLGEAQIKHHAGANRDVREAREVEVEQQKTQQHKGEGTPRARKGMRLNEFERVEADCDGQFVREPVGDEVDLRATHADTRQSEQPQTRVRRATNCRIVEGGGAIDRPDWKAGKEQHSRQHVTHA